MRVYITGALGFLGRYVVSRCLSAGWQVTAVSRRTEIPAAPPGVVGVSWTQLLSEPVSAGEGEDEPRTLLHLAWNTSARGDRSVQAEQVQRFTGLLDWAQRAKIRRVIAIGSAEEYGARRGVLSERDPPQDPLSAYGEAKQAARERLEAWSARQGVPAFWLRPFLVYGPGQGGEMLLPYVIRQAVRGAPAQCSDGAQIRDLVYVDDVAAAVVQAVTAPAAGSPTLNVATGQGVALREVLAQVAELFRPNPPFQLGAICRRPGEPEEQVACVSQAAQALGWRAGTDWRTGLSRWHAATMRDDVLAIMRGGTQPVMTWDPVVPQPEALASR